MLILSKTLRLCVSALKYTHTIVIPLLKLAVELKPRELRPFLDAIRHVLDMHRHVAARNERRPEEPQENALDESRHKRRRGLASLSRPNRTPKPTRPDANDTHPLGQISAHVVGELASADVLVLGSPVYYSYPTGVMRAFMERLMFPIGTYMYEKPEDESNGHLGRHITLRDKVIPTAMILTMNCPEEYMKVIGYPPILDENAKVMEDIFGYSETLYVCNTYQFNDYSRYDFNLFSEEDKRKYRDEHYGIDLQNAYELGKRLVDKAISQ